MSTSSPISLRTAPGINSHLTARDIHKTFRMGDSAVTVLKGVDLEVAPGEFIAIEGRSGTGKSTLLHVLAGLDASDSGSILAGDVPISELAGAMDRGRRFVAGLSPKSKWIKVILFPLDVALGWLVDGIFHAVLIVLTFNADRRLSRIRNRHFGFVFQFYHLLPELNVLENVLLAPMIQGGGNPTDRRQRARDLLSQFGMSHRLDHLPSQLSGGERQRVAIARALMNKPKVLFADEPTGNLDLETGRQIMDVLEALHRDHHQTIVMVTHDRTLARQADRVLVLRDGKLEPVVIPENISSGGL